MSLKKKNGNVPASTPTEKTTVIVQPIAMDKKPETAPRLNKWGGSYLTGKQVAEKVVAFTPWCCGVASATADVITTIAKCKAGADLTGKDKAKLVSKTILKSSIKVAAGYISSKCTDEILSNTFDLKK